MAIAVLILSTWRRLLIGRKSLIYISSKLGFFSERDYFCCNKVWAYKQLTPILSFKYFFSLVFLLEFTASVYDAHALEILSHGLTQWIAIWTLIPGLLLLIAASKLKMPTGNPCVYRGYEPSRDARDSNLVASNLTGNFSACKAEASALLKARQGIIFRLSKPSMFFRMLWHHE